MKDSKDRLFYSVLYKIEYTCLGIHNSSIYNYKYINNITLPVYLYDLFSIACPIKTIKIQTCPSAEEAKHSKPVFECIHKTPDGGSRKVVWRSENAAGVELLLKSQ